MCIGKNFNLKMVGQYLMVSRSNNSYDKQSLFQTHQYLLAGMWKRMAELPCWLPRAQQVLHQLGTCNTYAATKCE